MSIFDSFISKVSGSLTSGLQSKLDDAQLQLTAVMGKFLSSGQLIADLRTRAQVQQNSDKKDVRSQAVSIAAKSNGLMSQYNDLKTQATSMLERLSAMKNNLDTNPVFKFTSLDQMGTRVKQVFDSNSSSILATAGDSITLLGRIKQHNADVDELQTEVQNLEQFAQGKGVLAAVKAIGAGTQSIAKVGVAVGVAALAIYFLAPTFIARMGRKRAL